MVENTATAHRPAGAESGGCTPPAPYLGGDSARERGVTGVFVALVSSLSQGHDILEIYSCLVARCAELLDVAAAGLLLADPAGVLHVMAASSEHAWEVEAFGVQVGECPSIDCYRTGTPVLVADLAATAARWPRFVATAAQAGLVSVHAVPLRLGETVLGSLDLIGTSTGTLNAADLSLGHAFAYVASIALVAARTAADRTVLVEQLQTALNSRVVLEQAKGILAQRAGLDMGQAFAALRRYSRDHNLPLTAIAADVVTRGPLAGAVLDHARSKGVLAAPSLSAPSTRTAAPAGPVGGSSTARPGPPHQV